MEEKEIIEYAKKHLSEKRFNHSLGVMERAGNLAKIYGEDIEKARKVGIAHDIAKELSKEEILKYLKENNIKADEIELNNMGLLHGKIGADMAKKIFNFSDDMCEAIKVHTTGKINMSLLDKILYISDKTEYGRKNVSYDIEYIKKLSNENLDEAVIHMMDEGIKFNISKKDIIHPDSILARNYLIINK